jgi:hypothetical protein
MKNFLFLVGITLLFSCDKAYPPKEDPVFCWDCWQEHFAPNEHWTTHMEICHWTELEVAHLIKINSYANQDSTIGEKLSCEKKQ